MDDFKFKITVSDEELAYCKNDEEVVQLMFEKMRRATNHIIYGEKKEKGDSYECD